MPRLPWGFLSIRASKARASRDAAGARIHRASTRDRRPRTSGFVGCEPAGGGLWRVAQRRGLPRQERKAGTPRARRVKAGGAAKGVRLDGHAGAHLVVLCVSSKKDRLCNMALSRRTPGGGLGMTIAWTNRRSKCRVMSRTCAWGQCELANASDVCSRCPRGAPWPTPIRRAPWKGASPCRSSSARADPRWNREA